MPTLPETRAQAAQRHRDERAGAEAAGAALDRRMGGVANARVVAFNVDPMFNNSVDGLMYIRIADIPESTMKPVMEEFQAELERKLADKGE